MRITPLASLPGGGPDAVAVTTPPGVLQIGSTNALEITLSVSAGALTVTPYFWRDGVWQPLRGDSVLTPESISANFATVPVGHERFRRPSEPIWLALLKSGAGTLDFCDVAEAVL